jgi:hypothetical protein
MRCSFWLGLFIFLGTAALLQAGDPSGVVVPTGNEAIVYYWEPVAGSRKQELFASGHRIGLYDPDTEVYRRVNTDGTLSEPCTPPWKLNTRKSSEDGPGTSRYDPQKDPKKSKKKGPQKDAQKDDSQETKKPWIPREWEEGGDWLPEWAYYAIAIGLTGAVLGFGIFLQVRRM